MATSEQTILVTGGSGFIGSHCILQGLQKGYKVRTTIRNLKRTDEVKKSLRTGGATEEQVNSVQFFAVDLMKDEGWDDAVAGCTYVLHIASPFPPASPKHEDELIVPAREGTLRALRAAKKAGTVKRVVVTSSMAAIGYGYSTAESNGKIFTEEDWSRIGGSDVPAYQKSKTIAEKAAWDYIAKEGGSLELATVNPVGVFGPVLSGDFAASVEIVSRLLKGQVPAIPNLNLGIVDVRDVADLHFRAMTDPKANGQRYLAVSDSKDLSFKEIAMILKKNLPKEDSKKVTTISAPDFFVKLFGLVDPAAALVSKELGKARNGSNAKAKSQLGWAPRGAEEAILASAKSLKECGAVERHGLMFTY